MSRSEHYIDNGDNEARAEHATEGESLVEGGRRLIDSPHVPGAGTTPVPRAHRASWATGQKPDGLGTDL